MTVTLRLLAILRDEFGLRVGPANGGTAGKMADHSFAPIYSASRIEIVAAVSFGIKPGAGLWRLPATDGGSSC